MSAPTAVNRGSAFWLKTSLLLQIVLAAYFEAILWFPLGRWNDQPGKRLIQAAHEGQAVEAVTFAFVMLVPVLLFALALARRWAWLMWLGLLGYGTWAVLQLQSWWVPWALGPNARAIRNQEFLERTYKIFPISASHPAPDAMHFVLGVLLFAVVVTLAIGLTRKDRKARNSGVP